MVASLRHRQVSPLTSSCLSCRGGQSNDPYNGYPDSSINDDYYNPPIDADHIFKEPVQDRLDKWRNEQMEQQRSMSAHESESLRDAEGRLKLMATVGTASRALIFFVLMWRDIVLYEMADKALKGTFRLFAVVPLSVLFLANLAGVVATCTTGGPKTKKRLKAILNLDKLVEIELLLWYLLRLTLFPSRGVPREMYVASILHSFFFLVQCQSFTRITWGENMNVAAPPTHQEAFGTQDEEYYPEQGYYADPDYFYEQNQYQ
eukprot:scaffold6124_cov122-Cylindrotheca_fusiformis.AAC.24